MPHGLVKVEDIPTVFQDSLELRAKNIRFRGVGNPYAFLDGIGIIPIKEYLFRGANIIDVADTLNVPITLINNWIERNNFYSDIEEASVLSAEGYIYRGEKLLTEAENKFQLDKAKAMLEHGRFMASKRIGNSMERLTRLPLPEAVRRISLILVSPQSRKHRKLL